MDWPAALYRGYWITKSWKLALWGARAAILGGTMSVLVGLLTVLNPEYWSYEAPLDYAPALAEGVALLAVMGALTGLHLLHSSHYGRLGRVGFYMALAGTLVAGAAHLVAIPFLVFLSTGSAIYVLIGLSQGIVLLGGLAYLLGAVFMSVGYLLLGAVMLRARVLPVWCGPALILGLAGHWTLGNLWGWVVFGLAWAAVGYALSQSAEVKNGRSKRVG